ncbi:MAG: DUF4381 family protein [Ferruginibacter sp.]|nr:DUF4381 family protein [Ferruginibacter sp.]
MFAGLMSCFSFLVSYAQPIIKTSVDKNEILIGDQFKLTIEADFSPENYTIRWPVIPDSIPHFEVISRGKNDSLYNNGRLSGLVQTLTLTSFDSGKWVLPSFQVNFGPVKAGDTDYNFFTDSVPVTVSFSTSDTTNLLRDIKPIMEVETVNPVWYVIGAGMVLIALIIFLIWLYRYWKRNKASIPFQTKTAPYEEAVRELENLKAHNLSFPVEIKIVHSKLAEILKRYLSRSKKTDFLNKTTGDILIWLSDQNQDKNLLAKAAASLRCSDAVKFAKYLPPVVESETCLQSIKEVITVLQKQVQVQTQNPKS